MGSSSPSPGGMSTGIPRPAATWPGLARWASLGWERRPWEETGLSVRCREGAARQERGDGAAWLPSPPAPTPTARTHEAQGSRGTALLARLGRGQSAGGATRLWLGGAVQVLVGAPKPEWKIHKASVGPEPAAWSRFLCHHRDYSQKSVQEFPLRLPSLPPLLHDLLSALGVDSGGLGGRALSTSKEAILCPGLQTCALCPSPNPVPQPLHLGLGGLVPSA